MRSYFPVTAWLFNMLVSIETRLCDVGIIDAAALCKSLFHMCGMGDVSLGYMGNDHLLFLHRGVSICCTPHRLTPPSPASGNNSDDGDGDAWAMTVVVVHG